MPCNDRRMKPVLSSRHGLNITLRIPKRIQQEAVTAVRHAEAMAQFATSARIQPLELALELMENERVQLLARAMSAQRSPTRSSPGGGDYLDFNSECCGRSQPDNPPPMGVNVFNLCSGIFAKSFGHAFGDTFW